MDHPFPWLKYVSADMIINEHDQLKTQREDVKGLKVRSDNGENLGKVDGFVVDSSSGRPYYLVVDAGGWFKSKQFLVPIGHTRIDDNHDALVIDVSKERIRRFPGFDTDEFDQLTEADINELSEKIGAELGDSSRASGHQHPAAWERTDYQTPDWWQE